MSKIWRCRLLILTATLAILNITIVKNLSSDFRYSSSKSQSQLIASETTKCESEDGFVACPSYRAKHSETTFEDFHGN